MELWTIKGVPIETRKRIIAAALQEGLTVGRWLERRANEWLDHQELRELVQMASDLSPKDGSLLRLAEGTQSDRVKCRTAGWPRAAAAAIAATPRHKPVTPRSPRGAVEGRGVEYARHRYRLCTAVINRCGGLPCIRRCVVAELS